MTHTFSSRIGREVRQIASVKCLVGMVHSPCWIFFGRFGPRHKTGKTGFKTATGVDYIGELHEIGEIVFAHVPVGPKNALDWQNGIGAGKDGSNDAHIVLLQDESSSVIVAKSEVVIAVTAANPEKPKTSKMIKSIGVQTARATSPAVAPKRLRANEGISWQIHRRLPRNLAVQTDY